MGREIVFKFRDAVLLRPDHSLADRLKVDDNYYRNAAAFVEQAGITPIDTRPFFDPPRSDSDRQAPFSTVLSNLLDRLGTVPEYLFRRAPSDLPLRLLRAVQRPQQDRYQRFTTTNNNPDWLPNRRVTVPNFYNYFSLPLPDTHADRDVLDVLTRLSAFLPAYPDGLVRTFAPAPYLLDYVYLKNDPVPLGFTTPQAASAGANANQGYFGSMQLPAPSPATTGTNVGLSVLEANSWYASHSQFATDAPVNLLNPLAPVLPGFTLLAPGGNTNLPGHGTAIMGILRANGKGADTSGKPSTDLCRGIVPQATIRLASCLTTLQLGKDLNNIVNKAYNEAVALLQLIDGSSRGDVILLEVGAGGEAYPLEVTPAIYDLLRVAYLLEITVVAAAGNKSLYMPGSATDPAAAALRKQLISLDTTVQLNHSETFMAQYQAALTQLTVEFTRAQQGVPYVPFTSPDQFIAAYLASGTHAILVGAAQEYPANQAAAGTAKKLPASSWGPRIKVYAQGQNILTTTYGGPSSPNEYTAVGFTSGASAIIAGLVTSLQSRAKSAGYIIRPDEMASLLTNGTPVFKQINKGGQEQGAYTLPAGGVIPSYAQAAQALDVLIAAHGSTGKP